MEENMSINSEVFCDSWPLTIIYVLSISIVTPSLEYHMNWNPTVGSFGVSFLFFFETEFRSCYPGWSAMA